MTLDWKDILSQKIASGEIEREEFTSEKPEEKSRIPETIEVILDKKGRKGKTASLAVGEILIQGDRKEELKKLLSEMGYKVR